MPSGDDHPHSALCPSSNVGLPQLSIKCWLAGSNPHCLLASSIAAWLVAGKSRRQGSCPMVTDCCKSFAPLRSSCQRHSRDSHVIGSVNGLGPSFATARQLSRVTVVFGSGAFFLSCESSVLTVQDASRSASA